MRRTLAAAALWLAACAGAGPRVTPSGAAASRAPAEKALPRVEMSPFYFEGGAAGLDVYTDTDLFRRAGDAYDAADWKGAFNLYRKIIDKFPGSDYRILAFFNGALCLEQVAEYDRALDYFRATSELVPPGAALERDIDAHLGGVYERLGRYAEAAAAYERVQGRDEIGDEERWQFRARMLTARVFADDRDDNLAALDDFIAQYVKFMESRPFADTEWLAKARFSLGDVYYRRFRAIALVLPEEKLRTDLEAKAEALLRSQNQFMRTLQIKNVEWATAAVYRIGLGYEEFYHALNNAPVPPGLDAEEQKVYVDELREATEPVRKKAIMAYERIISFSNRLAVRTDWVEKAKQRVVELRTLGRMLDAGDAAVR
jgi:tetratricopeptide (TPR) repeat protein